MKLLSNKKLTNFSRSYIYTDANFAAPLPGQGANWLWNRVATDTALLAGAIPEAIGGRLSGQKLRQMRQWRGSRLDALDARGVRTAPQPPTIDQAVDKFRAANVAAPGGPRMTPGTTSSQVPIGARMLDDPMLEAVGRNYGKYTEGDVTKKYNKSLLNRPSL